MMLDKGMMCRRCGQQMYRDGSGYFMTVKGTIWCSGGGSEILTHNVINVDAMIDQLLAIAENEKQ